MKTAQILLADLFILLFSVMLGINSVMVFDENDLEQRLPPIELPENHNDTAETGLTSSDFVAVVTIKSTGSGLSYFYNEVEVPRWKLEELILKSKTKAVIIRADKTAKFTWQAVCDLVSDFSKSGVRQISYAVTGG